MSESNQRLMAPLALSLLLTTTCIGFRTPLDDSQVELAPSRKTFTIPLAPIRQLDLVVMIDNSPSMAPKQDKLRAQFPKLLEPLKDPATDSLPDLHVAIIDSDLGTGGLSERQLRSQILPDGTTSLWRSGQVSDDRRNGLRGHRPQRHVPHLHGRAGPTNFTGDINTVFACLAGGLGTMGCGEEHQLQAFEFALVLKGVGNDTQQKHFYGPMPTWAWSSSATRTTARRRPTTACSGQVRAAQRIGQPPACSTRAHQCGGVNLTNAPPGYPTSAKFEANFADCAARTDACPNPTDGNGGDRTPAGRPRAARSRTSNALPTRSNPSRAIRTSRSTWPASSVGPWMAKMCFRTRST